MATANPSALGFLLSLQTLPLETANHDTASLLSTYSLTLCPSTTSQAVC